MQPLLLMKAASFIVYNTLLLYFRFKEHIAAFYTRVTLNSSGWQHSLNLKKKTIYHTCIKMYYYSLLFMVTITLLLVYYKHPTRNTFPYFFF